jgi:predicted nucleic acid-binding protein
MARVVIADAGPLIAFAGINRLDVLRRLFSQIRIAESVRNECLVAKGLDAQRIAGGIQDGWLVVVTGGSESLPLTPSLGLGESDSMRVALEDPGHSLLVMDDRLARRYALLKGLNVVGSVRLLDIAQRRGLILSAEDCIRQMADLGYRVSIDLLERIRESRY